MSVTLMSLVFKHRFPGLESGRHKITPHVSKLVMLALSDHANDEGESAYPSITRLAQKTDLERRSVFRTLAALKQAGYIRYDGVSKYSTSQYCIVIARLLVTPGHQASDSESPVLVTPGHQPGDSESPESSLNHQLNHQLIPTPEQLGFIVTPQEPKQKRTIDEHKAAVLTALTKGAAYEEAMRGEIHACLRLNPNWQSKTWRALLLFLKERPEGQTITLFAQWWKKNDWRGRQGQPPTPGQIMELWPQAFASIAPPAARVAKDGTTQESIVEMYRMMHGQDPTPERVQEICKTKGIAYEHSPVA